MKWIKPGHEFDEIGAELCRKGQKFIIWGAGKAGQELFDDYRNEINVITFVDGDEGKIGTEYRGLPIDGTGRLKNKGDAIIIIAAAGYHEDMEQRLKELTYEKYKDYLYLNEFVTLFEMYKYSRLVLWHVNLHITDRCSLRCRDCSVFIPYIKEPADRDLKGVMRDIDLLFGVVDKVPEFHLLGGEPMLYPQLSELLEYIGERYRNKIGELAIATNGTLKASDKLLTLASTHKVKFIISDYRSSAYFDGRQRSKELCDQLEAAGIDYIYAIKDKWYDFGNPENVKHELDEEKKIERFSACRSINRILKDGRLYYCHHQVGAVWAGITGDKPEGYIDLEKHLDRKQLMEYGLGYTEKGYLDFCSRCHGYEGLNERIIPSAKQL